MYCAAGPAAEAEGAGGAPDKAAALLAVGGYANPVPAPYNPAPAASTGYQGAQPYQAAQPYQGTQPAAPAAYQVRAVGCVYVTS